MTARNATSDTSRSGHRRRPDAADNPLLVSLIDRGAVLDSRDGRLRLRAPRGALEPDLLDAARTQRDSLLASLDADTVLPLSDVQRRLWFLQQLDPSGSGYTFAFVDRLTGELEPDVLLSAVQTVLDAHPGLRAGFHDLDGVPVQRIPGAVAADTGALDCRGSSEESVHQLLREELMQPFDLAAPPLLRARLVRTGEDTWLWGIAYHHLVADGWTHTLVNRELAAAYRGETPRSADRDADPVADYADYVVADIERRDHAGRATSLAHWAEHLRLAEAAEITPEGERPRIRTYSGSRTDLTVPAPVVEGIRQVADTAGGTLFSGLLALHGAVLARHTGSERPTVGTPHANRPQQRFQQTMGCFVSTLPFAIDLSGDPTFQELTARTAADCAAGWDHLDFSYAQLVDKLAPERDTSRNALFQSLFALQDIPAPLDLVATEVTPVAFDSGVSQFEIEVHLTPRPDGSLQLTLLHHRDLFTTDTAHRLAQRWVALATAAAERPDQPLRRLAALLPADEDLLKSLEQSGTGAAPRTGTVDDLFAAQAARTPERTAITGEGGTLTYGGLTTAVDQLAALLQAHNPERRPVAVLLPRTIELPAALLAAIRAGCPFVPLAPDLPPQQAETLIRRNGITTAWALPESAAVLPTDVHRLDPRPSCRATATTGEPAPCPEPVARTADDTAYILHTSGTTGEPKGVAIGHQSLVNLLDTMAEEPGITEDDLLLAVTAPFFDIALLELFVPLVTGARLAVATDEQARDPRALAAALDATGATIAQATPSTWRMLTDTGWPGAAQLTVWSGGEPLARDLAEALLDRCRAVWNLYGPTETTIWSTRHHVRHGTGPVPIGRPVAHTGVHLRDRHGSLVPPGAPGELLISGRGLAQGYTGRPDLTAENFVPIGTVTGEEVLAYRTGDLARLTPQGTLVCLGRNDDQIKVRGTRVEPGEIESALTAHPAVLEAVAVTTDDGMLVAHVRTAVREDNEGPGERELAGFLSGSLRAALVPQRFVVHDTFPRTANGKVDRRTLHDHPLPAPRQADERTATDTERRIASLYTEALHGTPAGRTDDFFRLGGHSLTAVRLLHALEQRSGVRIPLHTFMADGRVETVAALVDGAADATATHDDEVEAALALLDTLSEEETDELLRGSPPTGSAPPTH